MGIPILDGLFNLGGKLLDKFGPADANKVQDQGHEERKKQIDATAEIDRNKSYGGPKAITLYAMAFAVIYGVVVQPFAVAFGLPLPPVDITAPLKILLGLFGLV
jgi:hypothetical protein